MLMRCVWIGVVSAAIGQQAAGADDVAVDGRFEDWNDVTPVWIDASGDAGGSGIDFGAMHLLHNDRDVIFRIDLGREWQLQEDEGPILYIDVDNDPSTGTPVHDIGSDFRWDFAAGTGNLNLNGIVLTLGHGSLDFLALPTVTSDVFEVAFGIGSGAFLFQPGEPMRMVLADESGPDGDRLPDRGSIEFVVGTAPIPQPASIERACADDLRLLTFNVLNDSPWDAADQPRFERLVTTIDPDVLSFQEIWSHSTAETIELVASWFPDTTWYGAGQADCKTISRYPILDSAGIDGNVAVLLDLSASALGSEMLIINAHLPCCFNDAGRRLEIEAILNFIRDVVQGAGPFTLVPDTPIVVTGDLNLVGAAETYLALLEGDLLVGADFPPDWDGTPFRDAISVQPEWRRAHTWRNDDSDFWPGRLDVTMYTDSVLALGNCYTLDTGEMSIDQLNELGIFPSDSNASDHLPVVTDFRLADPPEDLTGDGTVNVLDLLQLLGSWGPCMGDCAADLDDDGVVTELDMLRLLARCGGW